jgi:DNA-binding PadR family transcriptional regulator
MARRAQTATAVLGALSIEPMTGYEVRQAITTVLGHFWHESFGQIYPCLAELAADGLIGSTAGDRPGSSRYAITPLGRARLAELLQDAPTPQPPRNGLLLRVFLGASLPPGELAGLLDRHEAEIRERLATYAAIRADISSESAFAEHAPYWLATVRAGELGGEAQLQWIDEARAALLPPATLRPS